MLATFARKRMSQMNLVTNRKETCFICYRNTGLTLRPSQACVNYLSRNSKCSVQSHCWPYTTNNIFSQTRCSTTNKVNNGRHCFGNFYFQSRPPITNRTERRRFDCQIRKNNLSDIKINIMISRISYQQGKPCERCMREICNFRRICCQGAPERWP